MVHWRGGRRLRPRDYMGRGWQVWIPDSEADHINPSLLDLFFQAVKFGEKVRGQQS